MSGRCDLCNEDIEPGGLADILDHIRVIHPDVYGEGPQRWPDGGLVIDSSGLPPEDFMTGPTA